jgi:hypothetical protein
MLLLTLLKILLAFISNHYIIPPATAAHMDWEMGSRAAGDVAEDEVDRGRGTHD